MATDDRDDGKVTESPVDLANFVHEVHHFSALVEPLELVWTTVSDIRRWKSPNLTLALWLLCNIGGFIFSRGTVFVLIACVIFAISGISLFHVHTRFLDKVLPVTQSEGDQSSDPTNTVDSMQAVKEFRISLIQVYVILDQCNKKLIGFYSLLKWDNMAASLRFHIEFCVCLLCLCVFPVRWNFIVFINWFLLGDKKVHTYLRNHGLDKLLSVVNQKSGLNLVDQNGGDTAIDETQSKPSKSPDQKVSEVMDSHEKDDLSLSEGEYEHGSSESGNDSDSRADSTSAKPGVVSRLLEFKRRKQQMMTGHCFGCKTSFASILKRRHCCMHCGNYFCARCCSQKVPRSVFGATAPAAQTETVPVCSMCHTLLTNKEAKVC